jgi:hypothetical protein
MHGPHAVADLINLDVHAFDDHVWQQYLDSCVFDHRCPLTEHQCINYLMLPSTKQTREAAAHHPPQPLEHQSSHM